MDWLQSNGKVCSVKTDRDPQKFLANNNHDHSKDRIQKNILYKYPEAMQTICELYWNDFYCGGYEASIPDECHVANEREWHIPKFCVDLNNVRVQWPK